MTMVVVVVIVEVVVSDVMWVGCEVCTHFQHPLGHGVPHAGLHVCLHTREIS